jgi:hypothetical protein
MGLLLGLREPCYMIMRVGIKLVCARVIRPKVRLNCDQQTLNTSALLTSLACVDEVSPEVSIGPARTKFLQ